MIDLKMLLNSRVRKQLGLVIYEKLICFAKNTATIWWEILVISENKFQTVEFTKKGNEAQWKADI